MARPTQPGKHQAMADERPDPLPNEGMSVKTKGMLAVGGSLALFLAWLFAAAALPRWWSHRIGDAVDGSTSWGGVLGVLVGFLFTIVPLGVLRFVFRRHRPWKPVSYTHLCSGVNVA